MQQSGHLTACGGAEPHPTVKSASAASWEHFRVISKSYQKLWTNIINIFFIIMELYSFRSFSLWNNENIEQNSRKTRFVHPFLLSQFHSARRPCHNQFSPRLHCNYNVDFNWTKTYFLSQSFLSLHQKSVWNLFLHSDFSTFSVLLCLRWINL